VRRCEVLDDASIVRRCACRPLLWISSPYLQWVPGRGAPQVIPSDIMTRLVLHLDRDDAMGIACIPLLDPRRLALQARDGGRLEVVRRVQGWHKREIDLVPRCQIARRLAGVGELATFKVAKMPTLCVG
jgi:hypothetical protein